MTENATPQPAAGTRQQTAPHHKRLIASIVPRPELAAHYVALAALLHHPDLAAPYVKELYPADWAIWLHQIVARIALSHLQLLGRTDMRQLNNVLHGAGSIRPDFLELELATLARVGELICGGEIVADAATALTAHRQHRRELEA